MESGTAPAALWRLLYDGAMNRSFSYAAVVLASLLFAASAAQAQVKAPTPPMGWSSFGAYGLAIDEQQFRANITVMAGVQQFGWKYAILGDGWYMGNPAGHSRAEQKYLLTINGIPVPDPVRFPSSANGAGLRALGNWIHQQGLRFGIQIAPGIPRDAVTANRQIAGTSFHAADAADTTAVCPGNDGVFGVADNPAGQAYYDSVLRLYASWGVDMVRANCIGAERYSPSEQKQIAHAIQSTGRPMVLSLSSGPALPEHAAEIQESAQTWQVTPIRGDSWDAQGGDTGIKQAFDVLPRWFTYSNPDAWPDAGMLTGGYPGSNPGNGKPRQSGLTAEEQRTELAFSAIVRSPLILGANLTRLDDATRAQITNQDLLFMNQSLTYSRPVVSSVLGPGFENVRVWQATQNKPGARGYTEYFGFFNLGEQTVTLRTTWQQLGLDNNKHSGVNLWDDSETKPGKDISVTLPAHGSAVFKVN